jgi:hypothetical protein
MAVSFTDNYPYKFMKQIQKLFTMNQRKEQSIKQYHHSFQAQVEVLQSIEGNFDGKALMKWKY